MFIYQPIEQLFSLRSIPNLNVFRPADSIETLEAWELALKSNSSPSVLALTRQDLPIVRKNNLPLKSRMMNLFCEECFMLKSSS